MTSRPSPNACAAYTAFVAAAVLGWQDEADELIRKHRNEIFRTAAYLRSRYPITIKPVYRGLLLQAKDANTGKVVGRFGTHEYISFSEDSDVACWFASPDAFITPDARMNDPSWTGWVIEYHPKLDEILFHWSWLPIGTGQIGNLPGPTVYQIIQMNSSSTDAGERIQQLYWNLKSQQEVSLLPPSSHFDIKSRDVFGCKSANLLDKKLVFRPDWVNIPPQAATVLGVAPGRMPVVDIDYHAKPATCQLCGLPGITTTYYLRDNKIVYQHCFKCGKVSWGKKNPSYRRNADISLREAERQWQTQRSRESWIKYLKEAARAGAFPYTPEGVQRATGATVSGFRQLEDGFRAHLEYTLRPNIQYIDHNEEVPQDLTRQRGPYDGVLLLTWKENLGDEGPTLYLTIHDMEIEMGQEGYSYNSSARTFYGGEYRYHGGEVLNDSDLERATASDDWEQVG